LGGGGTPFYDTKMFLKVVFDKTAILNLRLVITLKQNIDETHSKQPKIHTKIHTSLWILKISRKKSVNQKSRMFVISKKQTIPYGMDLKIFRKSTA
jgi:hypothetical protein